MTALEFVNIMRPEHDRTSCSDESRNNSFGTRSLGKWYGRCTRCMWLDIADGVELPKKFKPDDCYG